MNKNVLIFNSRERRWSFAPKFLLFKEIRLDDKESDEVNNLTILKMMASKNYILSCYEVMVESKIAKNRALAKLGVEIDDCYCATKNDNSWSGKPG